MLNKTYKSGFTLVELIIVLVFISTVIGLSTTMILFSNNAHKVVQKEFEIQSDMRLASEVINQEIRHSTAVFMLNGHLFTPSNLKDGWNYFSVSDDGTEIVHFIWDKTANTHTEIPLVKANSGVVYKMTFTQSHEDALMVDFFLEGYFEDHMTPKVTIKSSLSALNTVVVDESGTLSNPSIAMAYRDEEIPSVDQVKVSVALVLDVSGSMDWDLNGDTTSNNSIKRITLMKGKAKELIDIFADMGNVHVALIPFSTNANNPGNFLHAHTNATSLKASIDGLNANGGTNVGDGLRRAYYHHGSFNAANSGSTVLNYTILLVDGNPTLWPRQSGVDYFGTGNISQNGGTGYNDEANITNSMPYIQKLGADYILKTDPSQTVFQKSFVIGFTAKPIEVSRAKTIAESYLHHPTDNRINGKYYAATNADELGQVFRAISDVILKETWHIYGPTN